MPISKKAQLQIATQLSTAHPPQDSLVGLAAAAAIRRRQEEDARMQAVIDAFKERRAAAEDQEPPAERPEIEDND